MLESFKLLQGFQKAVYMEVSETILFFRDQILYSALFFKDFNFFEKNKDFE